MTRSRCFLIRLSVVTLAIAAACAAPVPRAAAEEPAWRSLFDGRDLGQWRSTNFGGEGAVTVAEGSIRIAPGSDMSGITWGGDFPRSGFEVSLEARRDDGLDFFCGLTFPVGDDACSLIVGGWGGGLVGLSSIDGLDAANNDTKMVRSFKNGTWYRVRVRVGDDRIACFIDDEQVVDQPRAGHRFGLRDEVLLSRPLGVATYATAASLRNLRWRPLPKP